MASTKWEIGDLAFVPKMPLAYYSRLGDSSFWKVGIIINMTDTSVLYYAEDQFEEIHIAHIRKPKPLE